MPENKELEILSHLNSYSHSISAKIKFHEVDSFGVLHNIQYFYLLEWARTMYFENLGIIFTPTTFSHDFPVMTVHNEMNYFNPLYFNEQYKISTRIVKVGNSSMLFDSIILKENGKPSARGNATLVYVDKETLQPKRVSDELRQMIKNVEKENVEFAV